MFKLFRVGSKVQITPQMSKRYPGKILYTDHFTGKIGRVVENEDLTSTNLVMIKFENIQERVVFVSSRVEYAE